MRAGEKWRKLGWRHPVWDIVRFYCSLRHTRRVAWLEEFKETKRLQVGRAELPIDPAHVKLFFEYMVQRELDYARLYGNLRNEEDALAYCKRMGYTVKFVVTRSKEHKQSPKVMISTVGAIAEKVCKRARHTLNKDPQTRCVWLLDGKLHVTARNLDGAIPALANPAIVWEIKEYWGPTGGGSKMSDALYECNLVGRELREFEERIKRKVVHMVFLDGLIQWTTRKSDLRRFVDLINQGLIDYLFGGKEVEKGFAPLLLSLLTSRGLPTLS